MNKLRSTGLAVLASLGLLAALAGCDRGDDRTVGQRIDSAIEQSAQVGREVREGGREAAADTRTAVMGAASAAREGGSAAAQKIDDAGITTKVKTGLSADKDLNASRIDVDTQAGVVTLRGSAPTDAARQRASEIARNVKDVKDVKNLMTVQAG